MSDPTGYSNPTYGLTWSTCAKKRTQAKGGQNQINHVTENLFNQVPQGGILSFSVSQATLAFWESGTLSSPLMASEQRC